MRRICLFFLLAYCNAVVAASFDYKDFNPLSRKATDVSYLYITGDFVKGDAAKLREFVRKDPEKFIYSAISIDSNGGDVLEALRISSLIKAAYKKVIVARGSKCLSSCFFILSASVQRYMDGKVGIHRPYLPSHVAQQMTVVEMEARQSAIYKQSSDILKNNGVPQYLVETMLNHASNEVYWLTDKDKKALGFRPAWYEQMLISKCGLDLELEERFFNTNNDALFEKLQDARKCERATILRSAYERTMAVVDTGWNY